MPAAATGPAAGPAGRACAAPAAPGLPPTGRRSPKGRERWYLLRAPRGREAALCAELRRLLPEEVLADAFALRRERWARRGGRWLLEVRDMYPGYAFAVSADAAGLAKGLSRLTLPVGLVGSGPKSWAPLADEVSSWYASVADGSHVIRASTAVIEGGALRVTGGPLVGQEARISKVDRHRRRCEVRVAGGDGGFTERAALDVPPRG